MSIIIIPATLAASALTLKSRRCLTKKLILIHIDAVSLVVAGETPDPDGVADFYIVAYS